MKRIKLFSQIIAIILTLSMLLSGQPWTVAAAEEKQNAEYSKTYLSEVKMFYGRNEKQAKNACEKEGFLFCPTNLNEGAHDMDSDAGPMGIYMGYKLTEDPDEAITDITLLDMKNTHFTEMSYEEYLDKNISKFSSEANQMMLMVNEFRAQYQAGSPNALIVCDSLNMIYVDEEKSHTAEDNLLGNYLLEKADVTFFQKFLQRGNGMVLSKIVDLLGTACADYNGTTWVDRAKASELTFSYDSADSATKNLYDSSYQDAAKNLIRDIQNFSKNYATAKKLYDKYGESLGYDELKNSTEETVIEDLSEADVNNRFPEYSKALEIYALLSKFQYAKKGETSGTNAALLDENSGTETFSRNLTLAQYITDLAADESLSEHPSAVYPIIQALTDGQRITLGKCGFEKLVENLFPVKDYELNRKSAIKDSTEKLKELGCEDGKMFLWKGTDQSLYSKKVGKTDALMEEIHAGTDFTNSQNEQARKENDEIKSILQWVDVGTLVFSGVVMIATAIVGSSFWTVGMALWSMAATHIATSLIAGIALGVAAVTLCALYVLNIIVFVVSIAYLIFELCGGLDLFETRDEIDYDNIPDIVFDARSNKDGNYEVRYDAVTSNAGKDIFGDNNKKYHIDNISSKYADISAFQSVYDRWITMYYSKSPASGQPIEVKDGQLPFVTGKAIDPPEGYRPVTLINTTTAVNINDVEVDEHRGKALYLFIPGVQTGTAAEVDTTAGKYITDVVLSVFDGKQDAINFLKKLGYEYLDVNLTPGKGYTYLGYKQSNNKEGALRDLRVSSSQNDVIQYGDATYARANLEKRGMTPYGLSIFKSKVASTGSPITKITITNQRLELGTGYEPVCLFNGGNAVDFEHEWNDNINSKFYKYSATSEYFLEKGGPDPQYIREMHSNDYPKVQKFIGQDDPINGKYIYFQQKEQYLKEDKAGNPKQQYVAGFSYFLAGNKDAETNRYGNNYEFMQSFAKENGFELVMDGDEAFTTMSDSAGEMTLSYFWRDTEGYPVDTYHFDKVHTIYKGEPYTGSDHGLAHQIGFRLVAADAWQYLSRNNDAMIYRSKMYFGVSYTYNPYRAITGISGLVTGYSELQGNKIQYSGLTTPAGTMLTTNVSFQGMPSFAAGISTGIFAPTFMKQALYPNYEASQKSDIPWMTKEETEIMTHHLLAAGPKAGMEPIKKEDILLTTKENPGNISGYLPICDMRTPGDYDHPLNFALDTTNRGSKYLYIYQKVDSGGRKGEVTSNTYNHKKYVVGLFCGAGKNPEEAIANLYAKAAADWAGIAAKHDDISTKPTVWEFDEIIPVDLSSKRPWYELHKNDSEVDSLPNDEVVIGNEAAYYRWYDDDVDYEINGKCAYIGVVRSDNDYYTDEKAAPSTLAIGSTEALLAGGPVDSPEGRYFLYYSTNYGTGSYSAPVTDIDISDEIFINGYNTSFTVSKSDEKNNKLPEYYQLRMRPDEYKYIHLAYDRAELPYYEKLFIGVGKTKAEAYVDLIGSTNAFAAVDVNCNYNSFSDKWIAIGYRRTKEIDYAIRDVFLYYGDEPTEDMEEIYIKNTYSVEDDYAGSLSFEPYMDITWDDDYNEHSTEGVPYTLLKHDLKDGGDEIISLNEGNGGKGLYLYYTYSRFAYSKQAEAELFPITNICFTYGDISPKKATAEDFARAYNKAYYIRETFEVSEFENPHWECVLGVKGSPLNYNPSSAGMERFSLNEGAIPGRGNSGWHTGDTRVYMYVDRADMEQIFDGPSVSYTIRKNAALPEFGYYSAKSSFGKIKQSK